MRQAATVVTGNRYLRLYPNGQLADDKVTPSDNWRIIGAVTLNNFGNVTRQYSLDEILEDPQAIQWQHKNGNQKTHVLDIDHGTKRLWGSPTHYIY